MHIVVIGAGRIGVAVARWLLSAGHEIAVVEKDHARCAQIDEAVGSVSVHGSGTDVAVLARAGANRADVVIATTSADDVNLVACQLAKQHFGAARTMSLVNDSERAELFGMASIDASVDVTGAAIGLARLEIDRVTSSPVALGEGSVETEHGRLPLPAPATLELLRGVPTVPAHVNWETVTPTGAAILKTIVEDYGPLPALTIESIGLGAGNDRPGPMPNVLRAVLGRSVGAGSDRIVVLETNLDDLVPEHFDYLMERLFEVGALDVSVQPLQMKKNRPGHLVRVLGHPSDRISLARILFAESTAIGVRVTESDRIILKREVRRVDTTYGRVRVKRVFDLDGRVSVSPEYDDCKRLARSKQVPLRKVVQAAEEAGRDLD